MKLTKEIFLNNKKVNNFKIEGKNAETELLNLLFDKIKNRYKININIFDYVNRQLGATLYFNHELNNGTINKYKYTYLFTEIDPNINI